MSTERYKQIDEAAGDWLARRDAGDWSEADQRLFDRWLEESPLHRVAYLRIEHAWERSERLTVLGAGKPAGEVPPPNTWNLSPFFEQQSPEKSVLAPAHVSRRWFQSLAAAILLAVALGMSYHYWPTGPRYRTPVGGLASVPIADGSKVTLNTDSEIRVALTAKERRVELEHGEAFFEVAKDPARPFVVQAGNQRVVAVGTKFSVRREQGDIRIVVTEGKVRVETENGNPSGSAEPLAAGTIARASDAGVLLQTKPLAEAEESLSWRRGILVFRQMTLADASAEFNRYNTRKIVIEDPDVGAMHVAGSFHANNVEAFVRLLERGYPLRAEERSNEFVLTAR
jgi:transmembrane sensor